MRYVRRKDDPYLYGWTETLANRTDFFECDKDGKAVETTVEVEEKKAEPKQVIRKTVSDMNDVELEEYARKTFGVELDRRRNMDTLRAQVRGLSNGTLSPEDVAKGLIEPPEPEPEEDPFADREVPERPEEFTSKNAAIKWAKDHDLGISFRSRDSKARAISRIDKKLEEMRNE